MKVTLVAGVEQIVDLGIDATIISCVNEGVSPIYVKNNTTVTVGDTTAYKLSAGITGNINFKSNNCQYLHLISAETAEIVIDIKSIFKAIYRGDLVGNIEKIVDFRDTVQHYDVQNLSTADTLYFALDVDATIDGMQTLELLPGTGFSDDESVQKIHLISSGTPRYQVKGRR